MTTRADLEQLLDTGRLSLRMSNGNYWRLRRNGRTQTWKRDPKRFRIPVKMGFRGYGALTERDLEELAANVSTLRIEPAT